MLPLPPVRKSSKTRSMSSTHITLFPDSSHFLLHHHPAHPLLSFLPTSPSPPFLLQLAPPSIWSKSTTGLNTQSFVYWLPPARMGRGIMQVPATNVGNCRAEAAGEVGSRVNSQIFFSVKRECSSLTCDAPLSHYSRLDPNPNLHSLQKKKNITKEKK